MEQYNRHIKVSHRVVFPLELRLFNTVSILRDRLLSISFHKAPGRIEILLLINFQSDDAVNPDRLYDLVAVVIHCGSGPNRGHYISIVKSHGFWLLFDDDMVDVRFTTCVIERTQYYKDICIYWMFIYRKLKHLQ